MAADVTRDEFQQLEARVSAVEGEVEGEKTVTRYILEQTRRNGDDLAAIKTRLDRMESEIHQLRQDFPGMVADTMREVLRQRDGQ